MKNDPNAIELKGISVTGEFRAKNAPKPTGCFGWMHRRKKTAPTHSTSSAEESPAIKTAEIPQQEPRSPEVLESLYRDGNVRKSQFIREMGENLKKEAKLPKPKP